MKTKLDELVSSYLKNDKKAFDALAKNRMSSENIYYIEVAQRSKLVRDSRNFKSSRLKVWNLPTEKNKAEIPKKKEFAFPEFLEFALDEQERRKLNKAKTSLPETIKTSLEDQNKSEEGKIMMKEKSIWVTKSKPERKKAILDILSEHKELTILDLCRKHGEQIGVIWPATGKWNENPWKIVKSDCRDLEKEKKVILTKGSDRKVIVKLISEAVPKEVPAVSPIKEQELPTAQIHTYKAVDKTEIRKEIDKINAEVDKLSNEILEIWKTLAKLNLGRE